MTKYTQNQAKNVNFQILSKNTGFEILKTKTNLSAYC